MDSYHGEVRRSRQPGAQQEINMANVLVDARTRWLKPLEVHYILCNYQRYNFKLKLEAPDRPTSGSLYMFDKKVVRYFRSDGHNWRKKKDGKTVKEAHEKLKAGGTGDLLHCYYAHSEENGDFQRRCYWRLDGENEHIVLVHYLQVEEGTSRLHRTPPVTPPRSPIHPIAPTPSVSDGQLGGVGGNGAFSLSSGNPSGSAMHSQRQSVDSIGGDGQWDGHDEDLSGFDSQMPPQRMEGSLGMGSRNSLPQGDSRDVQSHSRTWWEPPTAFPSNGNQGNLFDLLGNGRQEDTVPAGPEARGDVPLGVMQTDMEVGNAVPSAFGYNRDPSFNDDLNGHMPGMAGDNNNMQSNWGGLRTTSDMPPPGEWPLKDAGGPGILLGKQTDTRMDASANMLDVELPMLPRFVGSNNNILDNGVIRLPSLDVSNRDWLQSIGISPSLGISEEMNVLLREAHQAKEQEQRKKLHLERMFAPLEAIAPPLGQHLFSDHGRSSFSALMMDDMNIIPPSPSIQQVLEKMQADTYAAPMLDDQLQDNGAGLARLKKLDSFNAWAHELGINRLEQTNIDPDDDSPLPSEVPDVVKRESDSYVSDSWVSGDAHTTANGGSGGSELAYGMSGMHLIPQTQVEHQFSICDFSPSSAKAKGGTKVLIVGTCTDACTAGGAWGVKFGEIEVPAEVVQQGVLRCAVPEHKPGNVSFSVTRNNGVSCSEIHEFEFKSEQKARQVSKPTELKRIGSLSDDDSLLQIRLVRMLMDDVRSQAPTPVSAAGSERTVGQDGEESSKEDEWSWMGDMAQGTKAVGFVQEQLLQMLLKRRLAEWLADKGADGNPPQDVMVSWLDEAGLGALHMVAALGYAWAVLPLISAGVDVDCRDIRGRTPLHWAAARGREQVIVALIASGAAPALLTVPDDRDSAGCTPADLAAGSGYKGIAAYLTQQALNRSLSCMDINERTIDVETALSAEQKAEEAAVAATSAGDDEGGMEGPAASSDPQFDVIQEAVRNSAHAAALIQFRYRQYSMRRRQQAEERELHGGVDEDEALAFNLAHKAGRRGHKDQSVVASATRIQSNFRRWRSRKEFLMLRQRIVRLQAHVRKHLQRQQYQKMRWSLGVLEKAILRWRMKNYQGGGPLAITGNDAVEPSPEQDMIEEAWRHRGGHNSRAVLDQAVTQMQEMVRSDQARAQYLRMLDEEQKHAQAQSVRGGRSSSSDHQLSPQGWEEDAMSTMG